MGIVGVGGEENEWSREKLADTVGVAEGHCVTEGVPVWDFVMDGEKVCEVERDDDEEED